MTRRALVLAGGGLAGIAWETGILCGIADESPTAARLLLDSDVLIGTSAGSAVSAQISSGRPLEELFARQVAEASAEIDPGVDIESITALFLTALSDSTALGDKNSQLRRIGAIALTTETVPEPVRRDVIAQRLPSHDWPDRDLRRPRRWGTSGTAERTSAEGRLPGRHIPELDFLHLFKATL